LANSDLGKSSSQVPSISKKTTLWAGSKSWVLSPSAS